MSLPRAIRRRPAFATLLVLWVVAMGAVVVSAVQTTALSEAVAGREALARVRAYWAARAGLEATIARLEYGTENPDLTDAYTIVEDMGDVAEGDLDEAVYQVSFTEQDRDLLGPADAHAKININAMSREALMLLPYMTEDVADAILDWVDSDEDVNPLGAEIGYYQSLGYPYQPRNAPMRSLQELELVAGVYPEYVRGEDWNLNSRLDPNEDDGDGAWPPDNADGALDAGWSALLTTESAGDVLAASGEERLDLSLASAADVARVAGVTTEQADVIVNYAATEGAAMRSFIQRELRQLASQGGGGSQSRVESLTNEQLAALLDECTIGPTDGAAGPIPGKLNINTAPAEVFEYLPNLDAATADSIILERDSKLNGFTSIVELLDVPSMSRRRLATIYDVLTVRSNAYVVSVRGRDARSGTEVEIVATVDRSTLPVVIRDITIR